MTLQDACAQWLYEQHLYGHDVCEAFWLYCYQRREEGRFWRLWQARYGCQPTTRQVTIMRNWVALQTADIGT